MQKHGGLICQQPVTVSISSNIEMQNVIAVARSKRPISSVSQQKREDTRSQDVVGQIQEQFVGQSKTFENFLSLE
jgi:hypothetical protein